ncbi:hypothetical protein DM02DRAFT_476776, partial [Periconia macrospinosa]
DPLPDQQTDKEPSFDVQPPDVDDDTDYAIESILDVRVNNDERDPLLRNRKGLLQYLCKWKDYPEGDDNPSWEPYMNVVGASDLVEAYHNAHPTKPKLHKKFKSLTGKQDAVV